MVDYSKWDKIEVSDSEDEGDVRPAASTQQHQSSHVALQQMMQDMPRREEGHTLIRSPKDLPPNTDPSNVLDVIHSSCQHFFESSRALCHIDEGALDAFVATIPKSEVMETFHSHMTFKPPLNFPSTSANVNFWCIHTLLSFGSSYDKYFEKLLGSPFSDVIMRGCIGMYLHNSKMDAEFMRQANPSSISSWFSIPLTVSKPMSGGAFTMDQPSPLRAFAENLARALFETGVILHRHGCSDFSGFISRYSIEGVAALVHALTSNIPSFTDHARVLTDSGPTYVVFASRAQFLAATLAMRFMPHTGSEEHEDDEADWKCPVSFHLHTLSALSCTPTPKVVGALIKAGVIVVEPELAKQIEKGKDLEVGHEAECALRCAAVVACKQIVEKLGGELTAQALSFYLTTSPAFQAVPVPICTGSLAY
eukprot:c15874_g1_i2.p1 GENE.c15874_g1_i2~~c15874_g1_i2.p1  ORF type:complete len:429 (+),score=94.40 c15874_g1_i2:24-1289(+)